MKRRQAHLFGILFLAFAVLQCNNTNNQPMLKFLANDPFQETIVRSQIFEIDAKVDNVVEGTSGTILAIPKGSFKNSKGETVTDNVKINIRIINMCLFMKLSIN